MARNKYPEETQKRIIEVSTKLFMEKGYEKTSLNDIISQLGGLTKGAIYHHFKSKEEIYEAVMYQLSATSDDRILSLIQSKEWNGRQKCKMILSQSLDQAILNHRKSDSMGMDYAKNPKMLYGLLQELKNEVAPMFIQPIIEQGILDGSIQTKYPKELAEFLAILINIWINPIVFPASAEEITHKTQMMSELLARYNLDLVDEELLAKMRQLERE